MDQHETTTPTERKPLGRRTVLKGAAWSVPAVVAVGATPAFAATGALLPLDGGQLSFTRSQTTGTYTWAVTNPNSVEISISSISFTGVTPNTYTIVSPTSNNVTIGAGGTAQGLTFAITGLAANNQDMADFTFTVEFESTVDARTGSTDWQVQTPNLAPNGNHTFALNGNLYT